MRPSSICLTAPEHGQRMKRQPINVKPAHAHSLPANGGDAHRRVCATETVLFRSRLHAAPIKFFAKVDYRKTIGPDLAR